VMLFGSTSIALKLTTLPGTYSFVLKTAESGVDFLSTVESLPERTITVKV